MPAPRAKTAARADVAPPAAPPPARATWRHRLRALRAGLMRGVAVQGTPLLGRGVWIDVAPGAGLVLEDGCAVGDRTRIHARGGTVRIGRGAVVGETCALLAHSGIEIGERALLADEVVVVDFEHDVADTEAPVRAQPLLSEPVVIGAGARIGPGAAIQRGVRVAPGASVGAHEVLGARAQ